ncbi:MAG: hypothetical protein ACQETH_17125 [Candidatus Rifleibacteriota bacterium]
MTAVSFKHTPAPGKLAKLLGWISFLALLFAIFRIFEQNPIPPVFTTIFAIIFLLSVILTFLIEGEVVIQPVNKKIVYKTRFMGRESSSIISDFKKIHAIGVKSSTMFFNAKQGLQGTLDNSMISNNKFWVVALTNEGKIIELSDHLKENPQALNASGEKAAKLIGCSFSAGAITTKLKPERRADGKYHFVSEEFDPVQRQNLFILSAVVIILVVAYILDKLAK